MVGPIIIDSVALVIGTLAGGFFGKHLVPYRTRAALNLTFGIVTIGIGTTLIIKAENLPAVVLALISGTYIGELLYVEKIAENLTSKAAKLFKSKDLSNETFITQFITIVTAICFGSMGIFGAINEGITGDPSLLITKAVLDLFCGLIFGATMGFIICMIAVPQFIILAGLFYSSQYFMPYVSAEMLNDFSSCGGIIFLATGMRMCGIKIFPIINMLPSLLLVMPLSWLWITYVVESIIILN